MMKMRTAHPSTRRNPEKHANILILSCSGGAGHIRAAEALHATAPLTGLPIRTTHYDMLDFTSRVFKKLYSESYLLIVNRMPELWGYLYEQAERTPYKKQSFIKLFDHINYQRYLNALKDLDPDAIICTHFLPYLSVSDRLRTSGITAPLFVATTDFDVNQLWIDPVVERYFVYNEESAWQLRSKGAPADSITVTGIPVMPAFLSSGKQSGLPLKIAAHPKRLTILVLSGGFGTGRLEEIVGQVSDTLARFEQRTFTVLVVCGKNEAARSHLRELRFPANVTPHIYGFVNTIHELMDRADLIVSKAGGLTSSEAMVKAVPMLIVDPIPGQESRNADIIVEHGAGWKAINLANLSYKLARIIERPSLLAQAKKATARLAKPQAAQSILNYVVDYLGRQSYRR